MRTDTLISLGLLVIAGLWIAFRTMSGDMGQSFVRDLPKDVKPVTGPNAGQTLQDSEEVGAVKNEVGARFHRGRTVGLWAAAIFTLCIFSFLYRDNPFYKFAESIVVGVSAAYWMVVGFWDVIVPNLLGKLFPTWIQAWAIPGLKEDGKNWEDPNYWYLAPLILGVMLLWRLLPWGGWISRWPLAFIIGTTAGLRLVGFLDGDFLSQIRNTVLPLVVTDGGGFVFKDSLQNLLIMVGVLSGLVYFFFSLEHKGLVGKVSRLGIWFLMITFGAGFGYTVMGRIALLSIRLEFLLNDWLWLIDPYEHRIAAAAFLGV